MAGKLRAAIEKQLHGNLTNDLNRLIRIIVNTLPAQSPQYTGFFASSWKASTSRPRPVDHVEDFSPWNRIKKDKDKDRSVLPRIQPRHSIPRFSFSDKVYVGNTAVYARYALASPSNNIPGFVQGELGYLVDFIFGDKNRPDVRIASTPLGFDGDDQSSIRGSKYTTL